MRRSTALQAMISVSIPLFRGYHSLLVVYIYLLRAIMYTIYIVIFSRIQTNLLNYNNLIIIRHKINYLIISRIRIFVIMTNCRLKVTLWHYLRCTCMLLFNWFPFVSRRFHCSINFTEISKHLNIFSFQQIRTKEIFF